MPLVNGKEVGATGYGLMGPSRYPHPFHND